MKTLMARLVGITLVITPAYGYAQICEAEIQEIERVKKLGGLGSLGGNHYPFVKTHYPFDKPGISVRQIVNSGIKNSEKLHCSRINFSGSRANLKEQIVKKEDMLKQWKRNESESIKRWTGNEKGYHQAVLSEHAVLAYWKYTLCVWDTHNITIKCKSSHSTSTQNLNSITRGNTQSPNPTRQPRKTNAIENAPIAKVNQPARPSSSKQSNAEYGASKCLSLIKEKTLYGGFINSCPFKVQYGYCVEEPKKGAWSESVDCSKVKGGGGQVIRAKGRDGQHTKGGKKVHWTACMYEDRNGKFLNVGPWDVAWDNQKKKLNSWCGHK